MYRRSLSVLAFSSLLLANAQEHVHQVLVLNEGYFNWSEQQQVVPVTLGSYDPATGSYQTVATITGSRFGSDVHCAAGFIYVAADERLLKYDADSYQLLAEAAVPGIRKIDVHGDHVLVTRGELGGLSHYFEVRSTTDLAFVAAITPAQGLPHSIEDVVVADGRAWLAVNNAFDWMNLTGYVAVVDLADLSVSSTIDLGPNGLNPEKLMVMDDAVYVLNNTDFSSSSLSKIGLGTNALQFTQTIALNSGCGASALAAEQEKVYFMEYAVNSLARFDLATATVQDTLQNGISAYGLIDDHISGHLYATTTDFLSSGELHVMDHAGNVLSTVAVGVSPGNLALDVRSTTGISTSQRPAFVVAPNPAQDRLRISGMPTEGAVVVITDALGRSVWSQRTAGATTLDLDVTGLRSGIYSVQVNGGAAVRFVKD
jgi:outer membrane protein assembly factor BamB